MPLDLEQTREYVATYRTPATSNQLVCVDGRTPLSEAGKIARGGAALGLLYDVVDAVEEQGIKGYPGEMIAERVMRELRGMGITFNYHTDSHAKEHAPLLRDLLKAPIGCKYAVVMREHNEATKRAIGYVQMSADVQEDVLYKDHLEGAVVLVEDEEETVPHQVEGGPMIFKWDIARDAKIRQLLVARLDIDGLDPEVVNKMAHRNVIETLAAIESARNLKMFTVKRHGNELVTDLAA